MLFAIELSLLTTMLTGCKSYWGKPGGTVEEFSRDSTDCAKEASAPQFRGRVSEKMYRTCMRAHGWGREKRQASDPGEGWFRGIENWN
jgi:hypothetical protein